MIGRKYIFKIDGAIKDSVYSGLPFGRRMEHNHVFEEFKACSKSIHFSAKHKSTAAAFREFKRLYKPTQWFLIDRDAHMYHDDSFQVWFTK